MPIRVDVPGKGIVEFPDGTSPEAMEQALAEFAQPEPPAGKPEWANMSKEEKVQHFMDDPFLKGAATGGVGAGGLATGAASLVKRGVAEPLMNMALGAQAVVKRNFPTVNLARVALREGVGATNAAKASRLGGQAAAAVPAAGRAADAAGAAPVTARQIISDLRPMYERAQQAEQGGIPGATQKVMKVARDLKRKIPTGGLSREDALVAKSEWQRLAKPALHAQAGELAAIDPRVASAVGRSFAKHSRAGAGAEGIGTALDRSQELMALERATRSASGRQPLLRMLLGAAAGGNVGVMSGSPLAGLAAAAVPMVAMSPAGLSTAARGVNAAAEPGAEALIRMLMASSHEQEP
jgi:hypothetical protein